MIVAAALAAIAASVDATALAGLLALVMAVLVLDARRWVRLAARSRVGARSEDEVRRALAGLEAEGWQVAALAAVWRARRYRQRRDRPDRGRVRIVTKTRTFDARHLAHARRTAAWLYRHRRRWCRRGALPVLCVVRARGFERDRETRFSWCRWTAWRRRSEPAPEPHPAPVPGLADLVRAERGPLGGLLVAGSGAGGGVGEHAGE